MAIIKEGSNENGKNYPCAVLILSNKLHAGERKEISNILILQAGSTTLPNLCKSLICSQNDFCAAGFLNKQLSFSSFYLLSQ